MPEIRQREPNDLIKSKGKGKAPGVMGGSIDNALRGKVQEHRYKKEESNEYATGIAEEVITDAAISVWHIPGNVKRTIQKEQPKTKEQVLNWPEPEVGDKHYTIEQQQRQLAVQKVKEQADEKEWIVQTIKEKPEGNTVHKQRLQLDIKTRSRTERANHKTSRTVKQAKGVRQSATKKAAEQGRQKFKREAQKKMAENANKAAKRTTEAAKKVVVAAAKAVKSVVATIAAAFGGVGVVAMLAVIVVIGALVASPLGIFFSNQSTTYSIPLSSAVSQINMEMNNRLLSLQSGDYTEIIVVGTPPNWTDVVAVFASYTAGAQTGVDVARLTPDRVSRLRSVFWMMCNITSSTETVTTPDSDPYDHVDNSRTETTLTITITGKTAEEMRTVYRFTPFQNETLDLLLSDTAMLNSLIGSMDITQQDALELLRSLPADLSPERRAVVEHALSLVGKVNYFWGGKSRVIGWDSRWGQLREVTSAGSPTTGTYRPFGLDCSGFADWVFYNASGGDYILGHGGGAASQHGYCQKISWGEAQPGDLVFYPDDSHVGIVGLRDETGNLLIIHCASGQNNVVITDSAGFMTAGRPLYYGE